MAQENQPELTEVRAEHQIDPPTLIKYMRSQMDGITDDLSIRQFEGGQSNPTYLLESGSRRWVLRKKPPGILLKSAHAVEREYRVMKGLGPTNVPVPKMEMLCEDESVIGTAFFVMEWVDGRIIMNPLESNIPPEELNKIYRAYVSTAAKLHSVDYERVGLGDFGRPGNYFARQISRWTDQYRASETDRLDDMEQLIAWLPGNVPEDDTTSIVHGDFTIRNMVMDKDKPEVRAILDWELSTIGHPLGDLAYACQFYYNEDISRQEMTALGVPEEQELIDLYCELTGRSGVDHWEFYIAFCKFRLAAICQGVYKRGLDGNASSQTALEQRDNAVRSARSGNQILESQS